MKGSANRHPTDPASAVLQEVSDGVFAYLQPDGSWWINNAGFLVGRRGVVSVDTCSTERRTRLYRDAITSVSPLPVRTLINTHHHGDHTFGNYLFEASTIIAHENARQAMINYGLPRSRPYWTEVDWGALELEPPFLTFTDGLSLWVDELRCEIRHVGTAAHTTNDSVVWIAERGVLFAGDLLFNGGTPFLLQGSVAGAITAIRDVIKPLGAETIIPGHGPVCGPDIIDATLEYLHFVQATARDGRSAGRTPLEAAREARLGSYAELTDAERIVGNLHRAYAELDGAPPGAPIDAAAAFDDMVAFNGGLPLACDRRQTYGARLRGPAERVRLQRKVSVVPLCLSGRSPAAHQPLRAGRASRDPDFRWEQNGNIRPGPNCPGPSRPIPADPD